MFNILTLVCTSVSVSVEFAFALFPHRKSLCYTCAWQNIFYHFRYDTFNRIFLFSRLQRKIHEMKLNPRFDFMVSRNLNCCRVNIFFKNVQQENFIILMDGQILHENLFDHFSTMFLRSPRFSYLIHKRSFCDRDIERGEIWKM